MPRCCTPSAPRSKVWEGRTEHEDHELEVRCRCEQSASGTGMSPIIYLPLQPLERTACSVTKGG